MRLIQPVMPRLPNFFLAGAPKAGTTSLYHYLDQHPQIYMSPIKEVNYFAAEIREQNFEPELRPGVAHDASLLREYLDGAMVRKRSGGIVTEWADYLRLFRNAGDQNALGEASVCYLWSATAAERIAGRIPNARILVMLRNPVDRAFSDYLQGVDNGAIRWSFREHIRRNREHRSGLFSVHYPFLEFGFYSEQLARFLNRFGRNVWIGFYEDFQHRPKQVMRDIFEFLDVDVEFSPDMSRRYREANGAEEMGSEDRCYLIDLYCDDVRKLSGLVGRNLDAWMTI